MWSLSALGLQAIRNSHAKQTTAIHKNLFTGVETPLPIEGGTVTVDATSNVRRSLTMSATPSEALWEALDTVGGEITVTQTLRYIGSVTENVPLGVFIVDQDELGYASDGTITLTCPDRWGKVQKNNFGLNRSSVPSNAAWQEIKRLVEGCWGGSYPFPGWSQLDESATAMVGSVVWTDGNRESAILDLCKSNAVEVFFDAQGFAVLRPVPVLTPSSMPVWLVNSGDQGVLMGADRTRDRTSLHNVVIVTTTATDVTFTPQEVKNTTAGDPLAVGGPLGYAPYEYSSPTLRNSAQARSAGVTILRKELGVAQQITLTGVANPALDAEDVIEVLLPSIDWDDREPTAELHIIDSVTIPLLPTGTQEIHTRSTRPASDGL